MPDGTLPISQQRRVIALQEATKVYGMTFAVNIAKGLEISAEGVEKEILNMAERFENFVLDGTRASLED